MSELQTEIDYEKARKAHRDFQRARMGAIVRGFWRKVRASFTNSPTLEKLGCFDEHRELFGRLCCSAPQLATVEVERITGSVGRCTAFDSRYAPLCSCTRGRWINVAKAYRAGIFLPPVKLYKIGESLFVYDGNHRVSVARSQDVLAIEAVVKELSCDPSSPNVEAP